MFCNYVNVICLCKIMVVVIFLDHYCLCFVLSEVNLRIFNRNREFIFER